MLYLKDYFYNNNDIKFTFTKLFDHYKTKEWSIEERIIEDNMLIYCRSGSGKFIIDNIDYEIKPNRLILIPRGVVHSSSQDNGNPVSVIAIRFFTQNSDGDEIFPRRGLFFDIDNPQWLLSIIDNLATFYMRSESDTVWNERICNQLIQSIFWNLLAYEEEKNFTCDDPLIRKAIVYIDDNFYRQEPVELEHVLYYLGVNHYEFLKRFKKSLGITFRTYLFQRKMKLAEHFLSSREYSIPEVATILGYSDRYIFSNQFKKYTGKTPTSV